MGKIIRRTVTITITETLTIVWTIGDGPASEQKTIEPHPSSKEEEPHEMLRDPVNDADPGTAGTSELAAMLPTPAAASDPQPDDVPASSTSGKRRKRQRRRCTEDDQRSQ